jgi:hypothetical protein
MDLLPALQAALAAGATAADVPADQSAIVVREFLSFLNAHLYNEPHLERAVAQLAHATSDVIRDQAAGRPVDIDWLQIERDMHNAVRREPEA